MNVVHLAINPAQSADPKFSASPQLLASILARVSRSAKTTAELMKEIGGDDESAKVESMLKWIDYGHSSIADNSPICLVLENVTELMAHFILNKCQNAGAIQQSTRYIKFDSTAEELASDALDHFSIHRSYPHWAESEKLVESVRFCYIEYQSLIQKWQENVPDSIFSEPNSKKRETYTRNFALDRARYALPLCHPTTLGLVMSGREWIKLVIYLLSAPHTLKEAHELGEKIKFLLFTFYPQLLKLDRMVGSRAEQNAQWWMWCGNNQQFDPTTGYKTPVSWDQEFQDGFDKISLQERISRHDPLPSFLGTCSATMNFENLDFGVIRELNRHRTGTRYALMNKPKLEIPLAPGVGRGVLNKEFMGSYGYVWDQYKETNDPSWLYFFPMCVEFPWIHTTTLDKVIYEVEIRTTKEAHFAAREALGRVGAELDAHLPGLLYQDWDKHCSEEG